MVAAIETQGLTRRFGSHIAVHDLTLSVPAGRIFGFLGLNGAGKTTTVKMLTTLLAPSAGRARVLGHDVAANPLAVRSLVGLVGEDSGESRPAWSPREYLGYFARVRGLAEPSRRVELSLEEVGIEEPWRRRAMTTFSTGMKRRVEVARALLERPPVLFLDEPTRGLDLVSKRRMWDLFRRLVEQESTTVFLSSHEVAEIQTLCSDLAVIARGRLSYAGSVAALGRDAASFERRLIELLDPPARTPPVTA